MDATTRKINSLERQLVQTRGALVWLAECACLSDDKQLREWAFGFANTHPRTAAHINRIASRHFGEDEFPEVPREVIEIPLSKSPHGCEARE